MNITPDIINSLFELFGCVAIWLNIRQIIIDKIVRGVSYIGVIFFFIWSFWNLFYYFDLDQIWSFYASIVMVFSNFAYAALLIVYTRKETRESFIYD